MNLPGTPDVCNRAVDRGTVDGRVVPDKDRVVILKRLKLFKNNQPVIEMIDDGKGVFLRRKYQIKRKQYVLLRQESGELDVGFSVGERPKAIGEAVDPLHAFDD